MTTHSQVTEITFNPDSGDVIYNSVPPGPFTREAGFLGYNEICQDLRKNNASWSVVWEACHKAPYMVNMIKWVSYDNERSVKLKADFAYDMKLGGVMVWSIETDDFHGKTDFNWS